MNEKSNFMRISSQPIQNMKQNSLNLPMNNLKKQSSYLTCESSSIMGSSNMSQNFLKQHDQNYGCEDLAESEEFIELEDNEIEKFSEKQKLENYELKEIIGSGSFGTVYRGLYVPEGKQLAIKVIKFGDFEGFYAQEVKSLCRREIQICEKIRSSHFLPVTFASILNQQQCYIITNYFFGFSLSSLIDLKIHLNPETIKFYLASLLLGIEQCHRQLQIIHRDIKPENIMILHNGNLKLLDFGCSRHLQKDQRATSIVGTSEYFSPEMFKENYTFDSDIWAFAIVAYELVNGQLPFGCPQNVCNEEEKFMILKKAVKNRKKILLKAEDESLNQLIEGILNCGEQERCYEWSIEKIKKVAYFQEIDWTQLEEGKLKSPIQFSYEEVMTFKQSESCQFDDF